MTKPIQLHVGYVGITSEGKRVEITRESSADPYIWRTADGEGFTAGGRYFETVEGNRDILGPWVEPPVDYNDGKWHRWAGGDRPVHPSSVVHATFLVGIAEPRTESRAAHMFVWGDCASPIVAFRVTKEYVEPPKVPREFWVCYYGDRKNDVLTHKPYPKGTFYDRVIHVREVMPDD
jgi:hypothetical protein